MSENPAHCYNANFLNPPHRYVLATGSTVFYAMLYGGLSDDKVGQLEET